MAVRWHGFRLTRRKNGLRNRRRLLGGVYATQKDQEPRAAAARSRPGRARMTGWSPGEHDCDLRARLARPIFHLFSCGLNPLAATNEV